MRTVYFDHPADGESVYGRVKGKALIRDAEGWEYIGFRDQYTVPESVVIACVDNGIEEIILNFDGWRRVIWVDDLLDYGIPDWRLDQDMTAIPAAWTTT
jgi:hypothetical protein